MIELLRAQLELASQLSRAASTPAERAAWSNYHRWVKAQIAEMERPPRPERPPPIRP